MRTNIGRYTNAKTKKAWKVSQRESVLIRRGGI